MEHLLFAGYLIVFAWLVTKVSFFKNSGLSSSQLIIVWLLKVMAGIFYGWIGIYYGMMAKMQDTWVYHYESIKEYELLLQHPYTFFTDIFKSQYQHGYSNFLSSNNSWWNDLHVNIMIKLLALFDLASFGNYYINLIFYSFLTLFGPIALYRVMQQAFPTRKPYVLLGTFLIPSFLYWTSGIHKDGLIFMALALIVYVVYVSLQRGLTLKGIVTLVVGLVVILAIRNYLIIILVPAILAWIVAQKVNWRPWVTYLVMYGMYILLFFTAKYIHPKLDFPQAVVAKQYDFMQLEGGSAVPTTPLQPTISGFLQAAPQAISISLLRPYPGDVRHLLSLAAAVEVMLLWLLLVVFLFWRVRGLTLTPFILFCLFFSVSVAVTIGYTVNFLGAVVRYRSIIWPFLMVPVIANIRWERIGDLLFNNIKK